MKRIFKLFFMLSVLAISTTSCLYSGLDELTNSSSKDLTAVNYTYRFFYNDTINKGTPSQDILSGRVCEVVFRKSSESILENDMKGFKTTLTYDLNSVQKAGPSGSVTKQMLFNKFKELIAKDGIKNLWVYVTISDAATITPVNGAPRLGASGDFSVDRIYSVKAPDGSEQKYIIKTVKGF